jgi:MFS family permease
VGRLVSRHVGAVLAGSAATVGCFALFYMVTVFALAQGTGQVGYPRDAFLAIQLVSNVVFGFGIVAAGWHADRGGPGRSLVVGALATIATGLVFGPIMGAGSLWLAALMLCAAMFGMGVTNAPLGSWLAQLFPVRVRYSGVAFAFNFGGMIGGALTPTLAQLSSTAWGPAFSGLLLVLAGLVSLTGVALGRAADAAFAPAARQPAG